jgi:sulfide dehydrogenase cytochrome subunit
MSTQPESDQTMSMKHVFAGAASAALLLPALLSAPALAAEAGTQADTPPCLIAGWENPASVCVTHTKTIAATCFICHGPNGKSNGAIPSLAGQDKAYLVAAMQDFKSGKREASVMKKYALGYTDSEYEEIAAYFAAIK